MRGWARDVPGEGDRESAGAGNTRGSRASTRQARLTLRARWNIDAYEGQSGSSALPGAITNGSADEIQEPGSSREIINAGSYGVRVRKRALRARLRDAADHCDRVVLGLVS